MPRRQPLAARVWGGNYRTWWPPDSTRLRKLAKRRSARRERQRGQHEIEKMRKDMP